MSGYRQVLSTRVSFMQHLCKLARLLISGKRPTKGAMINSKRDIIMTQISAAREASNIDMRVAILQTLNNSLPRGTRLSLPSMFTNAYVRRALETIEDEIIDSI